MDLDFRNFMGNEYLNQERIGNIVGFNSTNSVLIFLN
jgi:hypothetical protein